MRWLATTLLLVACRFGFDSQPPDAGLPRCKPTTNVDAIELGDDFGCARLADQTLACWGGGSEGQLGTGDFASFDQLVAPLGLGAVETFVVGNAHACAVAGGRVRCWGRNHTGQLGDNSFTYRGTPVAAGTLTNVIDAAAGGMNTCAITQTNELWCWGQGNGTTTTSLRVPTRVTSVPPIVDVALSSNDSVYSTVHGCVAAVDGTVYCWGDNEDGQLGVPGVTLSDVPVRSALAEPASAIAVGDHFTCARTAAGEVYCWGLGVQGRLGDGTTTSRFEPRRVDGLTNIVELVAHRGTACARSESGDVYCWGQNYRDELTGFGGDFSTIPVKLPFDDARAIALGAGFGCALDGEVVFCWGRNRTDRPLRSVAGVTVTGVADVAELRAMGKRTCARSNDGSLACWGASSFGELGDGTRDDHAAPVVVATDVQAFATGVRHTCAVTTGGNVACWGHTEGGQIDGTPRESPVLAPIAVPGIGQPIATIAAGAGHTCARDTTDALWCWGINYEGQLGLPNSREMTPPALTNYPAATSLTTGTNHTCVITTAGALVCGGRNNEMQIDSMPGDAYTPRQVLASATRASAGGDSTCAISPPNALCWGDNKYGQLGDGTHVNRSTGVVVLADAAEVALGRRHGCARSAVTGEAWCWGANDHGQLGTGTLVSTPTPTRAPVFDQAVQLALGELHTCALFGDRTVRCAGDDTRGQLGDGGTLIDASPTPAPVSCP